jgi:hypothetical protein
MHWPELGPCWVWTKSTSHGYGAFGIERRVHKAHRVAFQWMVGPIPEGLCVLHRCDNRPCVRPDHLFLGTRPDNTADMMAKGRGFSPLAETNRAKTHCINGHEFTPENTYRRPKGRECRACIRERKKRQQFGDAT